MKRISRLLSLLLLSLASLSLPACRDIPEYGYSQSDTFELLWTTLDEHYCFFREKNVDWDSVHSVYRQMLTKMPRSNKNLFTVCSMMLNELRDGHTNLSSGFETSYYRKWWSDYPENYNARLIEQYYFNFNYRSLGPVDYGILVQNVGYIRYPTFETGLGEGNIDHILMSFSMCSGLIIDVRNNGGGDISNVEQWVNRFIDRRTLAGYICHKTGPRHGDFSKPFAFYYDPVGAGHLLWRKPVVVIADRSTFSAANNFVAVMKQIPGVRIVGATTGGGSGMPFSSELANGWLVRFSACPVYDAQMQLTEHGVEPTEGCAVGLDPQQALQGHDTILDFAINLLVQ